MSDIVRRLLSNLLYYAGHYVSLVIHCGVPYLYPVYNWLMVKSYDIQGDGHGPWNNNSKEDIEGMNE